MEILKEEDEIDNLKLSVKFQMFLDGMKFKTFNNCQERAMLVSEIHKMSYIYSSEKVLLRYLKDGTIDYHLTIVYTKDGQEMCYYDENKMRISLPFSSSRPTRGRSKKVKEPRKKKNETLKDDDYKEKRHLIDREKRKTSRERSLEDTRSTASSSSGSSVGSMTSLSGRELQIGFSDYINSRGFTNEMSVSILDEMIKESDKIASTLKGYRKQLGDVKKKIDANEKWRTKVDLTGDKEEMERLKYVVERNEDAESTVVSDVIESIVEPKLCDYPSDDSMKDDKDDDDNDDLDDLIDDLAGLKFTKTKCYV